MKYDRRVCVLVLVMVAACGAGGCGTMLGIVRILFANDRYPMVITEQEVVLKVIDIASGKPAEGAEVRSFREGRLSEVPDGMTEDEVFFHHTSDGPFLTDSDGEVLLTIAGGGACYPEECETIPTDGLFDGAIYRLRIEAGDTIEVLEGELVVGELVSGETFEVEVISIGELAVTWDSWNESESGE